MKIGVISDCFKRPIEESIALAGSLDMAGIQIYAVGGEFCPDTLLGNKEKIDYYKKLLADNGLVISALCGDLGGHGFEIEKDNATRVEKTNRIVDLACELGTSVVTTHIGVIPEDESSPKYKAMLQALQQKICTASPQ